MSDMFSDGVMANICEICAGDALANKSFSEIPHILSILRVYAFYFEKQNMKIAISRRDSSYCLKVRYMFNNIVLCDITEINWVFSIQHYFLNYSHFTVTEFVDELINLSHFTDSEWETIIADTSVGYGIKIE